MRAISACALVLLALTAGVANAAETVRSSAVLIAADDTNSSANDGATGAPSGGNAGTGSTAKTASPS